MPDSILLDQQNLHPKLVVFDLDDTIWVGDVDCTYGPPFTSESQHVIACKKRTTLPLHPDIPYIVTHLKNSFIPIAVASRTTRPTWAQAVLDLVRVEGLSLAELTVHAAWGEGSKVAHFREIKQVTEVEYGDMIFFDNEMRNIRDVEKLGVFCVYCPRGMTKELFEKSFIDFRKTKLGHI